MSEPVEPIWKVLKKAGHIEEAEKLKNRWIKAKIERLVDEIKCGTC
jgi:hypothetical protein